MTEIYLTYLPEQMYPWRKKYLIIKILFIRNYREKKPW